MAKNKQNAGWAFGKSGNIITVSHPTTATGKVKKYTTTTGGLHNDVGFPGGRR